VKANIGDFLKGDVLEMLVLVLRGPQGWRVIWQGCRVQLLVSVMRCRWERSGKDMSTLKMKLWGESVTVESLDYTLA
jgi:hypothetical protein